MKKLYEKKKFYTRLCPKIIIYGHGKLAKKLLKLYRTTKINDISYFVDDDPNIVKNKDLDGIKILSFKELLSLSRHKIINNIIIAIPSLSLKI